MFQEGDIVEIPLPDNRTAVGRILHISQRTEGAIGFIVFGIKGELRNSDVAVNPRLSVLGIMYTDIDAAKHYGWRTVEHIPLHERDRSLTKRRVGAGVYLADDYIGSIEELGEYDLKPMQLYGMRAVYNAIQHAFGVDESNDS